MSYEGYDQVLCEKGHLSTFDCWVAWQNNLICRCGAKLVWWNPVNETNGSFDTDENGHEVRIDGYVDLEILKEGDRCPHCRFTIGDITYKIPHDAGHKIPDSWFHKDDICGECGSPDNGECVCDPRQDPPSEDDYCKCEQEEGFGAGLKIYEDPNKDIRLGFKPDVRMGKPVVNPSLKDEEEGFGAGL